MSHIETSSPTHPISQSNPSQPNPSQSNPSQSPPPQPNPAQSNPPQLNTKSIRFEQALTELQQIVSRLNQSNLSLDEALSLYERGVELANHGRGLITQAERRVDTLRHSLGGGDETST